MIMKRLFDLSLAGLVLFFFLVPAGIVALTVKLTSRGPIIYWSDRIGKHNKSFKMPKFRTMIVGTPAVATHLLNHSSKHLTPIGSFLRKSSLAELPQLINIIRGEMLFI